jgi:BirA family biotin operon repressor/biotin-[acetyl-CoA-carboxylase] ligase
MGPVNTSRKDSLTRAVRAAGITATPFWFDEVGSTNDEARRLAAGGAPEWTVIAAGHQTAGRGRLGRRWVDVPGTSLLCSVLLRPGLETEQAHVVALAAAVSMIDAAGLPAMAAKWPNDLVVGERKCGGILAEAEVRDGTVAHVVLGVGINVSAGAEDLPGEVRETATSLAIEGAETDADALLERFLRSLRGRLEAPGFARSVVDAYRQRCRTLGRRVRAVSVGGVPIDGRAADVDENGSLLVEGEGGPERVAFGEVTHLAMP